MPARLRPASTAISVIVALLVCAAFAGVSWALIAKVESGPSPPLAARAAHSPAPKPRPARHEIVLAGSGANLPLIRLLARQFALEDPQARVIVHDSIGSGGGLLALRDNAIDAALVSRPLRTDEQVGMRVVAYARAAVVFAAHRDVPVQALDRGGLLELYAGKRTQWSDGDPVVLFQRERGDSAHRAVDRVIAGFAEVNEAAWRAQRFPVAITDDEMTQALLRTEGACGLMDFGAIHSQALPLVVFPFEGVQPSVENVEAGRYPLVRDLALVMPETISPELSAFVEFLRGEQATATMRQAGYAPWPGGRP